MFEEIDRKIITTSQKIFLPLARFAIFIIYFWFGLLKVLSLSPASPLVLALLERTMSFISPDTFIICFGLIEMLIGLAFLIPRFERVAIALLIIHMFTTVMPIVLLPSFVWQSAFVPTLEGQYIIKNILFIALVVGIATQVRPSKRLF